MDTPVAQSPVVSAATDAAGRPRLQMMGIHKRFGATVALGGVDLAVLPGQVLALVGENGAGKSTLMKVLSGAHRPDEGQMWLDSKPYHPRNPLEARAGGVAMIYQELSLARHLSVMENILLGMEPGGGPFMNWRRVRAVAADALAQVGRPDIRPDRLVSSLSIADQQLVEIARAVAVGNRVLVLDEPTSSLTRKDIALLFQLVARLKAQGHSVVYISHFLEEVKEISDVFTVLRDGRSVGSGRTADASASQIVAMMVGREVADLYPRTHRTRGEEVLSVEDLAGPGSPPKPLSASLTLHRGEVLGIAGLVGAGRTEMLRVIFGLDSVRHGSVRVGVLSGGSFSTTSGPTGRLHKWLSALGRGASPALRWAQGIGMVSEDRKAEGLALSLSIAENLTLSRLEGLGPAGLILPSRQEQSAARWIKRLAVRCRGPAQPVGALSGGNQQKVAIARLLHHDVDVLLLDEPTRGIDVGSKAEIYRLIDELARGEESSGRAPRAVLIVSSYLPELLGVCDRIAVMCRGRLGPARPVAETDEHQIMIEATGTGDTQGEPPAVTANSERHP
jgi:ribose transport system ATP-binding protein